MSTPPIESLSISDEPDFLAREKALLGDEFSTPQDDAVLLNEDEFASQYPDISSSDAPNGEQEAEQVPVESQYPATSESETFIPGETPEPIRLWKSKRDEEIAEKDKISALKIDEITANARKLTDQFYEDYNGKKEAKISQIEEEEANFIAKRDSFFKNDSSVWDRAIKLIDLKKSTGTTGNNRDKTRFRDIMLGLKDKLDVPGAAA